MEFTMAAEGLSVAKSVLDKKCANETHVSSRCSARGGASSRAPARMLIDRLQGALLKSLVSLLSLASFLAIPASAKPKHWYLDKKWCKGTAVIGLSTALDAESSPAP